MARERAVSASLCALGLPLSTDVRTRAPRLDRACVDHTVRWVQGPPPAARRRGRGGGSGARRAARPAGAARASWAPWPAAGTGRRRTWPCWPARRGVPRPCAGRPAAAAASAAAQGVCDCVLVFVWLCVFVCLRVFCHTVCVWHVVSPSGHRCVSCRCSCSVHDVFRGCGGILRGRHSCVLIDGWMHKHTNTQTGLNDCV